MSRKGKVVVAMSGGVDSSVAAGLLVEQGYDVIGLTIKTYRFEDVGGNTGNESTCCSLDGINDARAVAARLGVPHFVLDFSEPFNREVIEDFVGEYLNGRTPNPCVICNRKIKWEELLKKAAALGAEHIATGHYARVRQERSTGRFVVSRGRDGSKDQSYALWAVAQESLARTMFPLGELSKAETRALAARYGLPVSGKGESYEICFIPDNDYERFLNERIPGLQDRVAGGVVTMDGRPAGTHRGYPFYTVGQRRGLGVAAERPLYVRGIDRARNEVAIGYEESLYHGSLTARSVNMMKYADCREPRQLDVKIRYKDGGGRATVSSIGDGCVRVVFEEKRRAITPGQSAVFYEGDDIVGGGIIDGVGD
ncbi:MAG: tRNA 2-thiouridine(34) synthase MnmA [Bacteroidota bacterium]